MKKRWIIGTASALVALGVGVYTVSLFRHQQVASTVQPETQTTTATQKNIPNFFTGRWTPALYDQIEKNLGKQAMIRKVGTMDPFQIVNGMHFKLKATNDPTDQKYVGQDFTFDFIRLKNVPKDFPGLMSLQDGNDKPMLLINELSAVGWAQFFNAKGLSLDTIANAYNSSPEYIFECESGSQTGKLMVATSFWDWVSKLPYKAG